MLFPEPKPIFYNDTKYVGEFKYALPNGQGTITYANGTKFVGNFRDGSYYGTGELLVDSKGNRYIGNIKIIRETEKEVQHIRLRQ